MKLLKAATVPVTIEAFFRPFGEHFRSIGWVADAAARGITANQLCQQAFNSCIDLPFSRNPLGNSIPSICREIRSIVYTRKYDLVHVHTPNAAFLVRLALRNRPVGKPAIVYTAHGFHYTPERRSTIVYWWLEKLAARWADGIIVVNKDDFELATKRRLICPSRLHLIPSAIGIDLKKYSRERFAANTRQRIREELGIPENSKVFLKLAEFTPRKRHVDALRALAQLESERAYLLLAGNGPLEDRMKELAAALGVQDRVRFLGFRRDVAELLIASDAVMLLSEREGLPRSLMEAMALGVPVIGTDVKGTRELVRDAGLMVPLGEPQAVSKTMQHLIDRPELSTAKASAGLGFIQQFSLESVIEKHEKIYSELIKARQSVGFL